MSCPVHHVPHYGEQYTLQHPQLSMYDQCMCEHVKNKNEISESEPKYHYCPKGHVMIQDDEYWYCPTCGSYYE